jgi:hypothetical protein
MGGVRRRDGVIAAGTAWAGLVLGHLLAYGLAYPAEVARRAHLTETGHGWLDIVALSLLAVIPAVLVLTAVRAVHGRAGGVTWARLAALQVPAFLLIEVVERGASVGQAFSDPAVLLGLGLQLLVAAVAALVLRILARVVVSASTRLGASAPRSAPNRLPEALDLLAPHLVRLVRARRRAPPAPIAA